MKAVLSDLEAALGYGFADPQLLLRALTHRSLVNEQTLEGAEEDRAAGDNERMEFLGDAVLGVVVAEALFVLHPEWREGELTRVRAQLVSRMHIAEVASSLELGRHLRLSRGEDRSGLRRKATVLSNAMEAVIGAIFLDGGLDPVRAFVRRQVMGEAAEQLARELRSGAALGNYKSALQEHLQATRAGIPVYKVKNESGPDHHKRFLVEVRLKPEDGEPWYVVLLVQWFPMLLLIKKHAEQDAARRALARLITAETGQTPTATMEELRPADDDLSAGTALYADEDVPAGTRMEQGEQAAK